MQSLESRAWHKYYHDQSHQFEFKEDSLYGILTESEKKYSEHTAITFGGTLITYKDLKSRVDRLAGSFEEMNVKKGERIGLMVGNHPDYIVAYYAAHALGLIVVQINPAYTTRELLQIVTDSEVSYIVADSVSLKTVRQLKGIYQFKQIITSQVNESTLRIEDLIESDSKLENPVSIDIEEDVAVIQYTGGTTGVIKGAMLTHKNLVTNVHQSFAMYSQKVALGEEVVLAATPLYHVYAMTSAMNLGIYMGGNILLIKKFNVDVVMNAIKKYQPTFFPGVPQMYISFVNYPKAEEYGLNCFKVCSSGSAPLPSEVMRKFENISGTKILEGFGMSETSPTTHRTPTSGDVKVGSIGIPVPDTDSRIVDQDHNELGVNAVGELLIKGPQVMKGYWNNEVVTNNALKNGWLHTGDLSIMDEDGYFYIVGRKKEMIIAGGFNIYPQEIENVLFQHPDVNESAVVGIPDPEKGEIVKAYITPKDGCLIDLEELKGYCYQNLTPYKVPKLFEIIDVLPRNTVGKLLKRKLVEDEKKKVEGE